MLTQSENFIQRHIGPGNSDTADMLGEIGCDSIDELLSQTIPENIFLKKKISIQSSNSEFEFLSELRNKSRKNKIYKSYIGMGYYDTITPGIIKRNIFENPGWYTQ